jgi:hypothetical protein
VSGVCSFMTQEARGLVVVVFIIRILVIDVQQGDLKLSAY